MLIYVIAYETQFSLFIKEMWSLDLSSMFDNAMDLENNNPTSDMLYSSSPKYLEGEGMWGSQFAVDILKNMDPLS